MSIRPRGLGAALVLAALLLVAPGAPSPGHAQMGPAPGSPLDQLAADEFDKAFLREMIVHHAMAVLMARPVVAHATHQELKALGQAIIDDQTREIGQMRGWARTWYGLEIDDPLAEMPPPGSSMAHQAGLPHGPAMHGAAGPPMQQGAPVGQMPGPGMPHPMSSHDMSMTDSFWQLPPPRLEVAFMSLMIPHHQGAIDMAKLVPERAAHQELKDLATAIIESQSAEIDTMNGWLAAWYQL